MNEPQRQSTRTRDAAVRHQEILEAAARLICRDGYERTSMQQIAEACGLTKAGLYHHVRTKEHLLLEIMSYGMDVFEERVLSRVATVADPVERLRQCMEKHILLVIRGRDREITIILHEQDSLTGTARAQINARKKQYIRFLESSFKEAIRDGRFRDVDPKMAAFSFLGTVNWIYKWYRPDGEIAGEQLAREMPDLFFGGLEPRPAAAGSGAGAQA